MSHGMVAPSVFLKFLVRKQRSVSLKNYPFGFFGTLKELSDFLVGAFLKKRVDYSHGFSSVLFQYT